MNIKDIFILQKEISVNLSRLIKYSIRVLKIKNNKIKSFLNNIYERKVIRYITFYPFALLKGKKKSHLKIKSCRAFSSFYYSYSMTKSYKDKT